MILQNINAYDQSKFEPVFKNTHRFKLLSEDFDLIDFNKLWVGQDISLPTPRQQWGDRGWRPTIFSAVPFYYLNYLTEANPKKIFDLGCGWNVFNRYINNIVGIDSTPPTSPYFYADLHDHVDDEFIAGHKNKFESVFSINTLHFAPLDELRKIILGFHSMIQPGGRGFMTLNVHRMIERASPTLQGLTTTELQQFIADAMKNLDIEFLVSDIDLGVINEYMNGNIRLVMCKEN